ncbi:phospholipid/cholesterol/gamma-HCH transport system substrate-binding protein [Haloechinothrix alba]|uniref:Phospholipid/cholesterol/gamma-HCH transport system substrate-binding protein n=1 Tax=Haloechinothrix alba TaxID=664784 RepID=A0A239A7K8_9PSEU|nr:MlaD family protein [Haloechinothrix alba]SNR91422.1 phospholipid/cholesterol/gamma-HCH transport system substrate-binding protein [Haloechinothrix alba]
MSRAVTKRRARSFLVGVGLIGVIAGATFIMLNAHKGPPGAERTVVEAAFSDIGILGTNADVRKNSRRIGRVADIRRNDGHVVVTMELEGDRQVYADARAAIWDKNALGEKFVELSTGNESSGPLGDTVIPVEHTEPATDIQAIFDVFDKPTRDALQTTLRELGGAAAGHGRQLQTVIKVGPDVVRDAGTVGSALGAPEARLDAFVAHADRLLSRFEHRQQHISDLLDEAGATLHAVNVDGAEPLAQSINKAPQTLTEVNAALDALHQPLADTRSTVDNLQEGAEALGVATPDLRGVLREAIEPIDKLPGVAEDAEPAVGSLTTTTADLRPLIPRVNEALDHAEQPLGVLAPYTGDLGAWIRAGSTLTADGVGDNHWLRLGIVAPSASSVAGIVDAPTNPYPAPGEAPEDRAPGGSLVPGE